MTINLSDLKAKRAAMDKAPWSFDEPEPPAGSVDIRGAECRCDDAAVMCPQHEHVAEWVTLPNAAGLCATVNAADVLIEIAEAALAWRGAQRTAAAARLALARATERADVDFGYAQTDEIHRREVAAAKAFDSALAKVSL